MTAQRLVICDDEFILLIIAVERFHFGLYAQVGYGDALHAVAIDRGLVCGGGALLEVELTTRMALSLRGVVAVLSRDIDVVLPVVLVGLAIY